MSHQHQFDQISGWCATCNTRDDMRLIGPGGVVFRPGHDYTPIEIHQIREQQKAMMSHDRPQPQS